MKRVDTNFSVDLFGFLAFLGLIFTGIIMRYILPPGSGGRGFRGGEGVSKKVFLSISRHEWGDIHFYLSIAIVALMVLHIILHFAWIKAYLKKTFTKVQ
jgi:hypothetical protein